MARSSFGLPLFVLTATLASMSVGCSLTKNLDEMHKSTGEMNQKMTTLIEQMTEMKGDTKGLRGDMGEMQGEIKGLRGDMGEMKNSIGTMSEHMTTMVGLMGKMTELNDAMQEVKGAMGGMVTVLSNVDRQMSVMPKMNELLGQMNTMFSRVETVMGSMDTKMNELNKVSGAMTTLVGKIDEMKTEMEHLRGDIGGMSGKLDGMTEKLADLPTLLKAMKHLEEVISKLNTDVRPAVAQIVRSQSITALKEPGALADKFAAAAAYVQAFDFQSYRLDHQSDQVDEEEWRRGSMEVFLTQMSGFMHGNYTFGAEDLILPDDHMKILLAVSAAMDLVFANKTSEIKKQKEAAQKEGKAITQPEFRSIWGMLKEALAKKKAVERGEKVPAWVNEILRQPEVTLYLAQIRVNILAGVAINNILYLPQNPEQPNIDSTQGNVVDLVRSMKRMSDRSQQFWKLGKSFLRKEWEAEELKKATVDYLRVTQTRLNEALEAKRFLHRYGYRAQISDILGELVGSCIIPAPAADASEDRKALLKALQEDAREYGKEFR